MISRILSVMLLCAPVPAIAQGLCSAPLPLGDPCLEGHWVGNNTAAERIRDALRNIAPPDVMREIQAGMAPVLGMSIYGDGFYHTLPIHHDVSFRDTSTVDPDTTYVEMDLSISTQAGYISGSGGSLEFCSAGDSAAALQFSAHSSTGGGETGIVAPDGNLFSPPITYTCTPDMLTMLVALPQPIGAVDYTMFRVPASRFDSDVRLLREAALEAMMAD